MDIQKEREAFEAWFESRYDAHFMQFALDLGFYVDKHTQTCWEAWQAAKAQAVPKWISVKNAMPKAGSQVLTYDDYGFVSVENIDGCEDPNNVYFSHWLPLPPVEQEPAND
ncbi:hypothetical protein HLH14_09205 [Acinetobacter sp. ANC 4282]|uniref:hypothetical protein n=1 Tax=Acinetobacter terrae TaxID=2731247 RepID=UPI0014905F2E|nr:hypothetical protein [Acinetobacter terrae]NNH16170.1 hypothetical protein [Acinetobacter terrae]